MRLLAVLLRKYLAVALSKELDSFSYKRAAGPWTCGFLRTGRAGARTDVVVRVRPRVVQIQSKDAVPSAVVPIAATFAHALQPIVQPP